MALSSMIGDRGEGFLLKPETYFEAISQTGGYDEWARIVPSQ
jgi:hypothetical protein